MKNLHWYILSAVVACLGYEVRQVYVAIQPAIRPAIETLDVAKQTCETFNSQAAPAVKAVQDGTAAVNNFKFPSWLRAGSTMAMTAEPEPTLNPDAWANHYVDQQHAAMRGGANMPTRAEVRHAVRSAFPAMNLLMVMYYVFMILLLL